MMLSAMLRCFVFQEWHSCDWVLYTIEMLYTVHDAAWISWQATRELSSDFSGHNPGDDRVLERTLASHGFVLLPEWSEFERLVFDWIGAEFLIFLRAAAELLAETSREVFVAFQGAHLASVGLFDRILLCERLAWRVDAFGIRPHYEIADSSRRTHTSRRICRPPFNTIDLYGCVLTRFYPKRLLFRSWRTELLVLSLASLGEKKVWPAAVARWELLFYRSCNRRGWRRMLAWSLDSPRHLDSWKRQTSVNSPIALSRLFNLSREFLCLWMHPWQNWSSNVEAQPSNGAGIYLHSYHRRYQPLAGHVLHPRRLHLSRWVMDIQYAISLPHGSIPGTLGLQNAWSKVDNFPKEWGNFVGRRQSPLVGYYSCDIPSHGYLFVVYWPHPC